MIKYEKSFEKKNTDEKDEFICDEIEYVQLITDYSRRRIAWVLKTTEKFPELWEGAVSVSYDETTPIRDYVIIIRVKALDFFKAMPKIFPLKMKKRIIIIMKMMMKCKINNYIHKQF